MWSAAILAGGRASRLGGLDKSRLTVGGRSILERQIAELSRLTQDILIVQPHPDVRRGAEGPLPAEPPPAIAAARLVSDRWRDRGPLAGIDAALAEARSDRVLVLACDMPFVTAPFLEHLLRLTASADAVVPRIGRHYHPLCAAYTRDCRTDVTACLQAGRLAIVEMLAHVRLRVVDSAEIEAFGMPRRLLANVNTPADIEELEMLYRHEA